MELLTGMKYILQIRRKIGSFLDSLRIHVRGGVGGMGQPKYGGTGGKGGSVIIQAQEKCDLITVLKSYPSQKVRGGKGGDSGQKCILGRDGNDSYIHVPVGVNVITQDNIILGELNEPGDRIVVAKGGPGGCPETGYSGIRGENRTIRLDLKLIADIGLVGFPNAGKSTLLAAVTNARPKIASYPFTTLRPMVGIMEYSDKRTITMADLPGLIEGAHKNVGMGHEFLRHCERTKLLLLVVDVLGFRLNMKFPFRNCLETVILLNKEIELYRESLLDKPAILVVNKMDLPDASKNFKEIEERLKNMEETVQDYPSHLRPLKPIKFDEIIPVSIKTRRDDAIRLRKTLRKYLDIYAEQEDDDDAENKLLETLKSKHVERGPLLA
ncbi:hypothetical protein V9T40_011414 [Parthenolecanium corni]|uniref:GTP-binding protein 10 n=1 Tax=Parthenolecanium corni TaxID=536013 RepID=A0AAN9T5G0_9HEMI